MAAFLDVWYVAAGAEAPERLRLPLKAGEEAGAARLLARSMQRRWGAGEVEIYDLARCPAPPAPHAAGAAGVRYLSVIFNECGNVERRPDNRFLRSCGLYCHGDVVIFSTAVANPGAAGADTLGAGVPAPLPPAERLPAALRAYARGATALKRVMSDVLGKGELPFVPDWDVAVFEGNMAPARVMTNWLALECDPLTCEPKMRTLCGASVFAKLYHGGIKTREQRDAFDAERTDPALRRIRELGLAAVGAELPAEAMASVMAEV
jgi:hypothetical protein